MIDTASRPRIIIFKLLRFLWTLVLYTYEQIPLRCNLDHYQDVVPMPNPVDFQLVSLVVEIEVVPAKGMKS